MTTKKNQKYFEGIGRRKEGVARVRITESQKAEIVVNERKSEEFFSLKKLQDTAFSPLEAVGLTGKLGISVKVKGGGLTGQAEAIRLGLSRALIKYNQDFQKVLKDLDYLKRDARKKERKKPGLKKARRAAQWRKR
jgi:small subunit ribosomal protein S9